MRIFLTILLLFLFIISVSASEKSNASGMPGMYQPNSPILKTNLHPQTLAQENENVHFSKLNSLRNSFEEESNNFHINKNTSPQPMYLILKKLSLPERENSIINIELNNEVSDTESLQIKKIQSYWNNGFYNKAITELMAFEKPNDYRISGIGIAWKEPLVVSGTEGVDAQIGARDGIYQTDLDVDVSNGNLLASLLFDDGTTRGWTVNISTDNGVTWSETFYWNSGSTTMNDMDAAVVGGYFWVGHIAGTTQDIARMRRFSTSDGTVDGNYSFQTIFDLNLEIKEISVFSNVDNTNNRIYFTAIMENSILHFYWSDTTGTNWTSINTGIRFVDHGLDATWNYNSANNYYLTMSYVNSNGQLYGVVSNFSTWNNHSLAIATVDTNHVTSVAAWQDTIMIAYQDTGSIKYRVSYNAGTSWTFGTIASGNTFQNPHITGRLNGGFGVVYTEEAGVFDPVYYRHRTYELGTGFTSPEIINDADCYSYGKTNIEWIPPLSADLAYGATWIFGSDNANFDRIEDLPPDITISPSSIIITLQEGSTDTTSISIYNTAITGSNDLIWDITEQTSCAWLSESPTNGIVSAGFSQNVDIIFDATALSFGVYNCNLLINSNDPNDPQLTLPVELIVEQNPANISVSQSSFTFTVPENETDMDILTIYNTAAAGAENLDWNIIDREISVVTKSGKNIPIRIGKKTEYIKGTHAPSSGMAPKEMSAIVQQEPGKNIFSEVLTPLDFGYGPENYNSAIGNFTLNNPEYVNLGGTYPSTLYAGAEFANNGNYSMMYCFDYYGNLFVSIDIESGIVDTIGTATPHSGESWVGLAADPTNGIMYAASTSIANSSLYTVDLVSGNATRVGEITNVQAIIAIAIDNSGQMYGYDLVTDSLVIVDKNNGMGNQIGPLGFDANYAQGMDFDESDGTLYLAAYNNVTGPELRIADPGTGMTTLVGPLGSAYPIGNVHITGFGIGNQGDCPWLSELPTSGTITPGNNQNIDIMVDVTGLPIDVYNCELRVLSNDPDDPAVIIPVELNVIATPSIVVSPLSVSETVSFGDSVLSLIQIENTGTAELYWNARVTNYKNMVSNPSFTSENANSALQTHNSIGTVEKGNDANQEPNIELIKGNSNLLSTEQFVLWDNGPLVNSPGTGAGGVDESVLQNVSLGMNTIGFGHQVVHNNRIADDFVVTGDNWTVDQITFFAYQTGSDTISTMTAVNYRVWDGPPEQPGSNVVFGDTITNMLNHTSWSHTYRVQETTSGNTSRPVMMNIVSGGFSLTPGRYWLDWQTDGALSSGPWAPPITITGMDSTGDGWQYTDAWLPVVDGGTAARQGFPFIIEGTADNVWMKLIGPVSGFLAPAGTFNLDLRLYGVIPDSVFTGEVTITSNDASQSAITIPIELTVLPPNSIDPSDAGIITKYELLQNYPNPFNPSTMIKYRLANQKAQQTTLKIYNSLGQLIRTLVNAEQNNGEYSIVWDGLDSNSKEVASGIYYYRLKSGEFVNSQKLIKLK